MKGEGRILVIGSGSILGKELVKTLVALYGGDKIIAGDIELDDENYSDDCTFIQLNIFAEEALRNLVDSEQIDEVYMLAETPFYKSESRMNSTWQLNVEGFMIVLDICKDCGISKLYWNSTTAVFGILEKQKSISQHATFSPRTVYGTSKAACEVLCSYYKYVHRLDVRSIRLPPVISPESVPKLWMCEYILDLYHHAANGMKYKCMIPPDMKMQVIYVKDATTAILKLMSVPQKNISITNSYNVQGVVFSPVDIEKSIKGFFEDYELTYYNTGCNDRMVRLPWSMDDSFAKRDWGWELKYDLNFMTVDILRNLM